MNRDEWNKQQLQKIWCNKFSRTATHCSYQRFASNMKSYNLTSSSFLSKLFSPSFCEQYRYAFVIMTWHDHLWIIITSLPYLFLLFLYHTISRLFLTTFLSSPFFAMNIILNKTLKSSTGTRSVFFRPISHSFHPLLSFLLHSDPNPYKIFILHEEPKLFDCFQLCNHRAPRIGIIYFASRMPNLHSDLWLSN